MPPAPVRVRAVDPAASRLLERGLLLSPTFQTLVTTLERSDVFVYIEAAMPRRVRGLKCLRGETRVAASTLGGRFLRITITVPDADSGLLATLGHELQHVVEIAAAPDVTDDSHRVLYYRQHGISVGGQARCTLAAQEAGARVKAEIREAMAAR